MGISFAIDLERLLASMYCMAKLSRRRNRCDNERSLSCIPAASAVPSHCPHHYFPDLDFQQSKYLIINQFPWVMMVTPAPPKIKHLRVADGSRRRRLNALGRQL